MNHTLKKTDLQLVQALQDDGRASYSELASSVGISSSTVAKRIRFLLESEAITIKAVPNPMKMGLVANALITIRADRLKIDDICHQLNDNFNVNLIQTVFGRFDILIIVYFTSWEELHKFINKDLCLIDGVIEVEPHYIWEMKKRYEALFNSNTDYDNQLPLKENDWNLIKELARDGRVSVKELAETLDMPMSIVSRKISTLVESEVIKIRAIPNPGKFGFTGAAFIVLSVDAKKLESICEILYKTPEIHLIMTMINGSEIIVGVQTPNNVVLYNTIKKYISHIEGINNTESFIWAEIKKRYYGWFLE